MDDYEFELHGVKFKYRDGSVFRYWDYKTKRNKAWKIVNSIKRKDHLYFEFTIKKKHYSHSIPIDYCELDDLPIDYWLELEDYISRELNPNPLNISFNDFMRGIFDTPDDCHYWSD